MKQLPNKLRTSFARWQRGFSLVELMVALVIGLIVSLAIYGILNVNEGHRRTTTSVNDIDQSGAYAMYQLDKAIRSAGSGFNAIEGNAGSGTGNGYGCPLNVALSGATLLPAVTAFPAPFAIVPQALVLAPTVIFSGAAGIGGDVLMAMTGSGGLGEAATALTGPPAASNLPLVGVAGFKANDLVLVRSSAPGSACYVEQVTSTFSPTSGTTNLPLANTYSVTPATSVASAFSLGQVPAFNLYGVGANNTLFRYDLLNPALVSATAAGANPTVFVDNVYAMRAIYGVALSPNTISWVLPTGPTYSAASLLAGTPAANTTLKSIKAIKIALIMQSTLIEKVPAGQPGIPSQGVSSTGVVTLFTDTPPATQVIVNVAPLNVRYRVYQATIPIRNALSL